MHTYMHTQKRITGCLLYSYTHTLSSICSSSFCTMASNSSSSSNANSQSTSQQCHQDVVDIMEQLSQKSNEEIKEEITKKKTVVPRNFNKMLLDLIDNDEYGSWAVKKFLLSTMEVEKLHKKMTMDKKKGKRRAPSNSNQSKKAKTQKTVEVQTEQMEEKEDEVIVLCTPDNQPIKTEPTEEEQYVVAETQLVLSPKEQLIESYGSLPYLPTFPDSQPSPPTTTPPTTQRSGQWLTLDEAQTKEQEMEEYRLMAIKKEEEEWELYSESEVAVDPKAREKELEDMELSQLSLEEAEEPTPETTLQRQQSMCSWYPYGHRPGDDRDQ